MWYWQLTPPDCNDNLLGACLDKASILPSLQSLVRHCVGGGSLTADALLQAILRSPERRPSEGVAHVQYEGGVSVLWLGDYAFFYVSDGDRKCRIPRATSDLPPWVCHTLSEEGRMDPFALDGRIAAYLDCFARQSTAAIRLLRSIDWGAIPLVWRPLFVTDIRHGYSRADCAAAQLRLLRRVAEDMADAHPEVVAEALAVLHYATGLQQRLHQ